jgi:hypothetical protein
MASSDESSERGLPRQAVGDVAPAGEAPGGAAVADALRAAMAVAGTVSMQWRNAANACDAAPPEQHVYDLIVPA